jgi:hypothetical protein
MPNIGLNFSPTQGGNQYGQNGQRSGAGSNPVMDAIKILSFRVPTTLGAGSPVAPGLLSGASGFAAGGGGGAASANPALDAFLRRFFGQGINMFNGQLPGGFSGVGAGVTGGMSGGSQAPGMPQIQLGGPPPGAGTFDAPDPNDPNGLPAGSSLPQMPSAGAMGAGSALPQATPYDRSAYQPPQPPMPVGYSVSPTEGYTPQGPGVSDYGAFFGGGRFGGY